MALKKSLNMQNNLAIFYCGTNGAGKSTLRAFNQDAVQIVIDSDHIAQEINPNNPRLADFEAGRKAIELYQFALAHRISFSMESTLSGHSILQRMKKAKENGFDVRLNYVAVADVDINLARVAARVKLGGHPIDEATIRQRYEVSTKHLLLALPYCDEVFIYDNSFEEANLIFWLHQKNIIALDNHLPEWCQVLQKELLHLGYVSI